MNDAAPWPDGRLEHAGHRGLPHVRELGAVEHAIGQEGHQDQEAEHAQKAEDGREADVLASPRVARVDARPFDADEDEHRDEHGAAHLVEHIAQAVGAAAPEVASELVRLEEEKHDDDEDADRNHLGYGHDRVDAGRFLDPAQDHEVHGPQDGRGEDHGDHRVALAEHRDEPAERRADQDEIGGVAQAGAGPEAEGGHESEIVAEAGLGISEDAGVEVRLALRQGLKDEGQHQHADAGDGPGDERPEWPGRLAERARQRENSRPDHRPHHHGGQRRKRKLRGRFRHFLTSPGPYVAIGLLFMQLTAGCPKA